MKERNREFTLNTISFGLSNARIEQDQAPHNAKLMVQERRINAYHGLSQLLQPENPSSKEAFLEAIAVWVTIYCVFLPTFISEEPKIDNNTLCRHQKPDIYSVMLEERAIFINGTIDDDTSSAVMAELLFLEAYAPEKTISLPYANTSIFQIISRKDNSEIKDNSIGIS